MIIPSAHGFSDVCQFGLLDGGACVEQLPDPIDLVVAESAVRSLVAADHDKRNTLKQMRAHSIALTALGQVLGYVEKVLRAFGRAELVWMYPAFLKVRLALVGHGQQILAAAGIGMGLTVRGGISAVYGTRKGCGIGQLLERPSQWCKTAGALRNGSHQR